LILWDFRGLWQKKLPHVPFNPFKPEEPIHLGLFVETIYLQGETMIKNVLFSGICVLLMAVACTGQATNQPPAQVKSSQTLTVYRSPT